MSENLTLEINEAYKARTKAVAELVSISLDLETAERKLKAAEMSFTLAGLDGKNAPERNAHLFELTKPERGEVDAAKDAHAQAKLAYELARLECSRLRLLVDATGAV